MQNLFSRSNKSTRSTELEDNSTVICPECDEQLADDMEEYALDDTESVEIRCPSCGVTVEVEARVVTCYVAKVAE